MGDRLTLGPFCKPEGDIMTDDNVSRTDNAPKTDTVQKTDYAPGTAREHRRPPKDGRKYYGQGEFQNVTLHLKPKVWMIIKELSKQHHIPLTTLVSEALARYVLKSTNKQAPEKMYEEAQKVLKEVMLERCIQEIRDEEQYKFDKILASRHKWNKYFWGIPWPLR